MTGSNTKPYLLLLLLTTTAYGLTIKRDATREVPEKDDDFEGVVEEYLLAMEQVDIELRIFYENSPPGLEPDPHTDAQENLKRLRLKLKDAGLSEVDLTDLLNAEKNRTNEFREHATDRRKRTISAYEADRWTKGIVPYLYTDETNADGQEQIERAMHVYERFTCIRYEPWVDNDGVTTNQVLGLGHPGHLKFVDNDGCWSFRGNKKSSAGQSISCCGGTTCVHELGHALGLAHEQQSPNPDRNWIISVNYENIKPDYRPYYVPLKDPSSVMQFGYDLSSYMHYATTGFGIGSAPTYDILVDGITSRTGHYYLMMTVSLAHKCEELFCLGLTSALTCQNDGYLTLVDGKCACRCLPGLDPDTGCTTIYKSEPASLTFPPGKYALTAPAFGCPKGSFLEGSRTHYNDGGNIKSLTYSLKGDITDQSIEEHFCVSNSAPSATKWPNGNYCIYRKGGVCPDGFKEGFVQFDDNHATLSNQISGELPDGVFDKNTRFEFCCQRHGFSQDEMFLPSRKPLVLIKHPDEDCQKIRGMHVTVEYTKVDNSEDEGVTAVGGENPIYKIDSGTNAYWTRYCYYTPAVIDCGDIIELDANNPTATFSSPATANELECYWLIKAPPGERIQLDFNSFNVKSSQGRCVDEVEIRYSRPGQLGQNYCGNKLENTITSYNNTVHIRLSTFGNSVSSFSATAKLLTNACYDAADRGTSFAGIVNFTSEFVPCVSWRDATQCIYNPYNIEATNTLLTENYCRNPDFKTGIQPWCYINTNCERKYCDVCLTGNRFDKRDDCSSLKSTGFCSQSSALENCAETCKADLPDPGVPTQISSVTCGQPNPVTDSTIVETLKSSYSVGEKVTYKCKTQTKTKERVCLTSGEWSVLGFACGECPDGWHIYRGNCYSFFQPSQNFPGAKAQCSEFDAVVAPAKSQEDNEFLSTLAQGSAIWLGMTDEVVEGTWVFTDGGEAQWTNWASNQPDNWQSAEHCVAANTDGKWNDVFCSSYSYPHVCMKAKAALLECLDFWDQCDELLAYNPTMCTTQSDFAEQHCALTCGYCSTGPETTCPLTAITNAQTDEQRSSISVGESVTFTCNTGYMQISGDTTRACQVSGSLTGNPAVCIQAECPSGWSLYKNHCYQYNTETQNYANAKAACSSQSGTVATAKTEAEQNFLHSLRPPKQTVWIGLDDIAKEELYIWLDGEFLSRWTNWENGQPNNFGYYGQDCVVMRSDKSWDDVQCTYSYTFVCKVPIVVVECNVDSPQPNSQTTEVRPSVSEGEVVTYTCNSGFEIQFGDARRTCLGTGSLSGSPLTCVAKTVECKVDSPQPNSQTTEVRPSVSEGEVVTYTCNSGFEIQTGDARRTCLGSGSLSGSPLTCVAKTVECKVDSPQPNSQTTEVRPSVSEGEVVTYTCNSGFEIQFGDARRTCLGSGSLSGSPLTCVAKTVECNVDSPQPNSQTTEVRPSVSEGEVVTYTCNSGFEIQTGDARRTCLGSGSLSGSPLTCVAKIVECNVDSPQPNSQTTEVRPSVSEGEVVTYTCNSGFEIQFGDARRTCLGSGSLSGSPLTCVAKTVECNVDSPQPNSQTTEVRPSVSEGEVVTYTCNSGFEIQFGDARRICLGSGSLSGSPLTCVAKTVECKVDSPQPNSQTTEVRPSVSEGEVVTYTCNNGFEIQTGDASRTCLGSGSLSGSPLTCVAKIVECNVDSPQPNSQTTEVRPSVSEGEVVTYTCNSGFKIQTGDASRTCQGSGSLSGSPLTCVAKTVECNVDSPQPNSQTTEVRPSVSEGEVVKYTCNIGFEIQTGDASRTCLGSGSLSGSPLTCVAKTVECKVDSPQPNSQTTEVRPSVSEGDVVTYTCNSGFEIQTGDASRTCLGSGSLSGSPLTCVAKSNLDTECLDGWTINPENNHCYKYFDQRKNYIDAEKICSDNKGVLAMPKTASQLDFVHSLRSTDRVIWIGLDDRLNEGAWVWADGTVVTGWTNWQRRQPDDARNGQDCGRMQRNKKWVDVECYRRLRFVCEVSMSGCPAEWTLNSVNNQCYRFFDESMVFPSAQARCASFQSILATAKTQNELDFISDLRDGNTIWLGLNDITTEGTWYWTDGQALNGWTNWSPGHPTARTPGHDCVSVTPGKLWRNVLCFYSYHVICQMGA